MYPDKATADTQLTAQAPRNSKEGTERWSAGLGKGFQGTNACHLDELVFTRRIKAKKCQSELAGLACVRTPCTYEVRSRNTEGSRGLRGGGTGRRRSHVMKGLSDHTKGSFLLTIYLLLRLLVSFCRSINHADPVKTVIMKHH